MYILYSIIHFRAWCNEITGIISSEDIAKDVSGAELSLRKHQELKAEIDTRQKDINRFTLNGQRTIKDGHFLSSEVFINLIIYKCHIFNWSMFFRFKRKLIV